MKQVLVFRVSYGYAPMQHDELWQYQTAGDNRVCFTLCEPCNGQTYRGDYLLPIFEYAIKVNDVEIEPHQHKGKGKTNAGAREGKGGAIRDRKYTHSS